MLVPPKYPSHATPAARAPRDPCGHGSAAVRRRRAYLVTIRRRLSEGRRSCSRFRRRPRVAAGPVHVAMHTHGYIAHHVPCMRVSPGASLQRVLKIRSSRGSDFPCVGVPRRVARVVPSHRVNTNSSTVSISLFHTQGTATVSTQPKAASGRRQAV